MKNKRIFALAICGEGWIEDIIEEIGSDNTFHWDNEKYKSSMLLVVDKNYSDELEKENASLREVIKKSLPVVKEFQSLERERIFEEAGCPGGPVTISTDLDETVLNFYKAINKTKP